MSLYTLSYNIASTFPSGFDGEGIHSEVAAYKTWS